jgi:hypothetical protein
MAYMITHFWPGATEDQYKATVAVVHPPRGLPEGQSYHVAGMTDGGVLITAVWDSKEQNDRFLHDVLMASMPIPGGVEGQPEERSAEVMSLRTLAAEDSRQAAPTCARCMHPRRATWTLDIGTIKPFDEGENQHENPGHREHLAAEEAGTDVPRK